MPFFALLPNASSYITFMTSFITFLQGIPCLLVITFIYITGLSSIILMHKILGKAGLLLYAGLSMVLVNLQVLKIVDIAILSEPVAMGTTLMMTTFLVTDIMVEKYSRTDASKAVYAGFLSMLFSTIIMIFTLGANPSLPFGHDIPEALKAHDALATIFLPTPSLFAASLGAYAISQLLDIYCYDYLRNLFQSQYIVMRSLFSTLLSSLVDSIVFSTLAWRIFNVIDISNHTLIFTYILGTFLLRIVIAGLNALCLPLMLSYLGGDNQNSSKKNPEDYAPSMTP